MQASGGGMIKNDSEKIKLPFPQMKRYVWVLAVVWTIVTAGSLIWHSFHTKQETLEVAQTQARVAYEKDIIYRRWNAGHGGVYVAVTKETQPNPYLSDVPERDITTPSGKALTLMNPAYMTRQAHELEKRKLGVRGHITSLNPIRPENAPDPWETEALRAFGRGVPEINSVEEIQSKKYMRLMRPLITEKGCLKCHAKQGYHEGDIRGGISVSIPMDPFLAFERKHILTFALIYGLLWIVGLSGIGLGTQRLMRTERERRRAEEALQKAHGELERKVEERTADISKANIFLEQEISERKLAEESLRESEEQFRAMFEVASIGIAQADIRTGKWLRVNQKMCEITGYSADEMLRMRIPEITHPEDRQRDWEAFQCVVRGETPDYRYIRKDGTTVWVNVNMTVIRDADGQPLCTMATIEDITERKRMEEELKRNESRMIALLELNRMIDSTLQDITSFTLEEAIRLTESKIGYLAFLNEDETVMTMYAWSKTAMKECRISDKPIIYPVETTGLWGEAVRQRRPITTNDYQAPNTWKKSYPEGHVHITRHMNIPVFDGERIVLVAGVGNKPTDYNESDVNQLTLLMEGMWRIIQRQRAETEIKQLNAELEQRVIERTVQLEAVNKELEAFSYSVSHDLRAPIRHISGFVELLMQNTAQSLDEKSGRYLSIIADSTNHMGHLIDDILSFSRMGRAEMQQTLIKSDHLVKEAINQLQPEMEGRHVVWDIHPLPEIYGDPPMLKLVWINLIGNALKYTRKQTPAKIEIGYNDEKNDYIFYIKDNGAGFDMMYVHKLFNIFQRLHRAEEFEGTGVGLANVRRIMQRHGGRTWAEGKVNEGATFYFSLPKAKKRVE